MNINIKEMLFLSYNSILEGKSKSVLTILATSVGVGTIVFLMTLGYGIEKMIRDQISSPTTLRVVTVNTNGTRNDTISEENVESINGIANVKTVDLGNILPAVVTLNGKTTNTSFEVYGDKYLELSDIKDYNQKLISHLSPGQSAVSLGLAKALGKNSRDALGSKLSVEVLSNQTATTTVQNEVISLDLTTDYLIDDETPYIIASSNNDVFLRNTKTYNVAKVLVDNQSDISKTRTGISQLGLNTTYLGDTLSKITSVFSVFQYLLLTLGLVITAVAVLGAFNTLTISLMRRTQEIGILKIHGAQRADIALLFLSESILITFLGSFIGLLGGIFTGFIANNIFNFFAVANGGQKIQLFYTPYYFLIYLLLGTVFVGVVVGIYPAIRASKISILDAIKYE